MQEGKIMYRGVILSTRQVTFFENNKVKSNLEITFKLLEKEVEKEVTNSDGTKTVQKVWEKTTLPMFNNDGTTSEGMKISLSNSGFSSLPMLSDKNVPDSVKKVYYKLIAETENRPFAAYSNVSALAKYMLEGRGIMFRRDLYEIGDKFITPNGAIEAEKRCYQTIVEKIAGTMQPLFIQLCEEWVGNPHVIPTTQPTPATTPATSDTAMFANL